MDKVTPIALHRPRAVQLSPKEQLECLVLAQMNQERAELCTTDQAALAAFFLMNAKLLMKVAGK